MAHKTVGDLGACIRVICAALHISESYYHYERIFHRANEEVTRWLNALTDNQRNWSFDLCYLRNVKGFK